LVNFSQDKTVNFFQDKTEEIKNPDALPDAGVREAIELPTVGERRVIQI
jgi:hypothetical protein